MIAGYVLCVVGIAQFLLCAHYQAGTVRVRSRNGVSKEEVSC